MSYCGLLQPHCILLIVWVLTAVEPSNAWEECSGPEVLHCRWTAAPEVHTCCTLLCAFPFDPCDSTSVPFVCKTWEESKIYAKVSDSPPSYFVGHKDGPV